MALSFRRPTGLEDKGDAIVFVQRQREMARLLAFAGWTIDDVVNNPLAKREVYNWYCMSRRMQRRINISELERQWNATR